ncbi:MFS transporter [Saccharomonospora iraqiensis]|uniref:MFS transporter n=1 Tax=Saccharomonospora iraqiensis TaxID=52698 RepID=UPI00022E247D|nr:MFS transporter [Saccharomonospora iraqiensis]
MGDTVRRPLGVAYRWLWTSSGLSNLADGVVKVALPLVAIQYTRSPTLIAGLAVALVLPWLLFALPAGAFADRFDRRRMMLGANTVRIVLSAAGILAVALDAGSIWLLYGIAFGLGTAETVYDTSAQSIMPRIVERDQLSRANSRLFGVELTTNQFVGPPLAGLLVAAGVAVTFAAPTALWGLALVALLFVRGSFGTAETGGRTSLRTDIAEGLRFLWRHRLLRTLAVLTGTVNFATNAAFTVFVLFAVGPSSAMGLSEPAYGVLFATTAVGSLIGSLVAERVERTLGRARTFRLALLTSALLVGIPAVTTNPVLIGAAFFTGGVGIMLWNVIAVSLRQRITPDRLLGRLNSSYRLLAFGTQPLGALAGGAIAEVVGLRWVFGTMALLVLLALLGGARALTDDTMNAAERDTAQV